MKKKMYLVKREVIASNIKDAMVKRGRIYCIELAEEKSQPEENKSVGFIKEKVKKIVL